MAYTNPVADFVSSLDSFYESVSIDDLELAVGPIDRGSLIEKNDTSSIISLSEHQSTADTDIDDECFHDVMESTGELKKINVQKINQFKSNEYIGELVTDNHIPISQQNGSSLNQLPCSNKFIDEFQLQIRNTVSSMKNDLDAITNRVAQIELKLNQVNTREQKSSQTSRHNLYQMIFLFGWPIVVQFIFIWFQRRSRQNALKSKP